MLIAFVLDFLCFISDSKMSRALCFCSEGGQTLDDMMTLITRTALRYIKRKKIESICKHFVTVIETY